MVVLLALEPARLTLWPLVPPLRSSSPPHPALLKIVRVFFSTVLAPRVHSTLCICITLRACYIFPATLFFATSRRALTGRARLYNLLVAAAFRNVWFQVYLDLQDQRIKEKPRFTVKRGQSRRE